MKSINFPLSRSSSSNFPTPLKLIDFHRIYLLAILAILLTNGRSFANSLEKTPKIPIQEKTDNDSSGKKNDKPAKVIAVYKEGTRSTNSTDKEHGTIDTVQLDDLITVKVENLSTLITEAKNASKNIVLYLDERPLKNATAFPPTDPEKSTLSFLLKRNEGTRDVWTYLLGKPSWDPRETRVSVGIEDKFAIPSDSSVNLNVIPLNWFTFWAAMMLLFLGAFMVLAFKSDLLRDPVPLPVGGYRKPYSLARTQIAWWFFLVIASYLFIGMITGDFSTSITTTVLSLIGISAGTVVSSAFIDSSKESPADIHRQRSTLLTTDSYLDTIDTAIATLEATIAGLQNNSVEIPANSTKEQLLSETIKMLENKKAEKAEKISLAMKLNNQSENFLLDILSDANGVCFHRFQMAAWTVVLGIIFIAQVYKVLAMPTFDATLLALLGISAGTYLGLKIPENTTLKT